AGRIITGRGEVCQQGVGQRFGQRIGFAEISNSPVDDSEPQVLRLAGRTPERQGCPTCLPSSLRSPTGETLMFNWIKKVIGGMDRTEAASERAAVALEGIADLLEKAHLALQQRLGAADEPAAVEEKEPVRNGSKRIASA